MTVKEKLNRCGMGNTKKIFFYWTKEGYSFAKVLEVKK